MYKTRRAHLLPAAQLGRRQRRAELGHDGADRGNLGEARRSRQELGRAGDRALGGQASDRALILVRTTNLSAAGFAMLQCRRAPPNDDWDFHANALTPCNVFAGPSGFDANHRGICMTIAQPNSVRPRHRLADPAGDHHLRLRDRAAEFWAAIQRRLFHSADGPGAFIGPRRLRPRAGAAEPVVGRSASRSPARSPTASVSCA